MKELWVRNHFSHQDVATDILYHGYELCCLSMVSQRKRRDGV
jgi:hypothetical protein